MIPQFCKLKTIAKKWLAKLHSYFS